LGILPLWKGVLRDLEAGFTALVDDEGAAGGAQNLIN
jgi:hypothetical protein